MKKPSAPKQSEDPTKKKRNKKKSKLTDTDLMNNFMKSLHSQVEEEPQKKAAEPT